jgi:hypothetical protein
VQNGVGRGAVATAVAALLLHNNSPGQQHRKENLVHILCRMVLGGELLQLLLLLFFCITTARANSIEKLIQYIYFVQNGVGRGAVATAVAALLLHNNSPGQQYAVSTGVSKISRDYPVNILKNACEGVFAYLQCVMYYGKTFYVSVGTVKEWPVTK